MRTHRHTHAFALANQDRQCERDQSRAERPFIALDRPARQTYVELGGLHLGETFAVNLLHGARPVFQLQIKSSACLRDFAQTLFIQFRFHHLSSRVFHEGRFAIFAADRNKRALRRPHADCENPHTGVGRSLCALHCVSAQLFAIGENDQRAISHRALAECARGQRDRFGNVRAAFGKGFCVESVDRLHDCAIIDCARRLQEGAPSKSNQADAIAL